MNNYAAHYPPGADADLLRREREHAAVVDRLHELERNYREDPRALAMDYPGDHIVRLGRMLGYAQDRQRGKLSIEEFEARMAHEYAAVLIETVRWQAKQEGVL